MGRRRELLWSSLEKLLNDLNDEPTQGSGLWTNSVPFLPKLQLSQIKLLVDGQHKRRLCSGEIPLRYMHPLQSLWLPLL